MIRIITYNCSIVDLYDLIFLQEIWLFKFELNLISTILPEFEAYGISAIQDSEEIINGRPYGGLAILIRKQYRPICDFQTFDDSRLLAVTISSSIGKYCFINVYMPYQHDDNYGTFMECIGKLSATIVDFDMCNFIILGDFNSAVDTPFESELVEFCSSYDLIISDYHRYGRDSGQFTYVSDAHNSTSWLDHIICSYDDNSKISSINILDKLPGSDHLPLQMTLDIDFNSIVDFIDKLCSRDKVSFNWSKCTLNELSQYCCLTYDLFTDIHVTPGIKCNNPNCEISSHKADIDYLYKQITASKKIYTLNYLLAKLIIIGNTLYLVIISMRKNFIPLLVTTLLCGDWRSAGKPRFGEICFSMNQSILRFKSALKYCQQNETIMRANALAESMMNNDMDGFWKDVHKITNSKVPLATKVDEGVGDAKIAKMWKCHYKSLLNSVQSGNLKNSVMLDVNKQIKNSITITPFDILDALKNIKCGKSSGDVCISAEHFVFAHSFIHVLLSLLFSAFITHGY